MPKNKKNEEVINLFVDLIETETIEEKNKLLNNFLKIETIPIWFGEQHKLGYLSQALYSFLQKNMEIKNENTLC